MEDGDADPFARNAVGVGRRVAFDQAVEAEVAPVVVHLRGVVVPAHEPGHLPAKASCW